jgi:hypothetical protein
MKFQKVIRMPMMLAGLGIGLLLANPVRAQQEVDPTYFEVAPGAPQANQPAAVAEAPRLESASAASAEVAVPAAADFDGAAIAVRWTEVDTLTTMATILCLAFVILHGIAETRRERQSQFPA